MRRTRVDEIEGLLADTADPDPKCRTAALRSLCPCHFKRNEPRVWDRVLELVADPSPEVRRAVFHLLGDGSPRQRETDVVAAMACFCHDSDERLRRRARRLMARYRRGSSVNIL